MRVLGMYNQDAKDLADILRASLHPSAGRLLSMLSDCFGYFMPDEEGVRERQLALKCVEAQS